MLYILSSIDKVSEALYAKGEILLMTSFKNN